MGRLSFFDVPFGQPYLVPAGTPQDQDAVRIDENRPEPYYYMGLGYKVSYEFRKAAAEFTRVLSIDKALAAEADREYAVIQRIERAMPGTKVGKKIALLESIDRADVAALFIEELQIDDIFRRKCPGPSTPASKALRRTSSRVSTSRPLRQPISKTTS